MIKIFEFWLNCCCKTEKANWLSEIFAKYLGILSRYGQPSDGFVGCIRDEELIWKNASEVKRSEEEEAEVHLTEEER